MTQELSKLVRDYISSGFQNFEDFKSQILTYIQDGGDINSIGKRNEHCLIILCGYGDYESMKLFVDKGANVNYVDLWGCTPLNNAIMSNKFDFVKYLVQNNVNINYIDNKNNYPIDYAISYNLDIAKYLYSIGAQSAKDLTFLQEPVKETTE